MRPGVTASRARGSRPRVLSTPATAALGILGALAVAALAHAGSQSFSVPGSYSFEVPSGVTSLHVVAIGAGGGPDGRGGHGARVEGDFAVDSSQILFIDVGAAGGLYTVAGADAGHGGFAANDGFGGGGSSDVRTSDGVLSSRVIVAGGGGGQGGGIGAAGGDAGADGAGGSPGVGDGGKAGGESSGGMGGAGSGIGVPGDDGAFGAGGNGGPGQFPSGGGGGGGGGGGWYGGGGGGGSTSPSGGGGGGGSSHAGPGVTGFTAQVATSVGDGSIALSWTDVATPPDTTPPDTSITKGPTRKVKTKKSKAKVTFEFGSDDPGASFECSLDNGEFAPCTSPDTLTVKKGKHTFQVRATDAAGNADPSPASQSWKVKRK